MKPVSYTPDSDAFQDAAVAPLPWAVQLILCFLLFDSAERLVELVMVFSQSLADTGLGGPTPYRPGIAELLPLAIWVAVNPVLATLLWLRTAFGRVVTQVMFVIHLFGWIARDVAIIRPELWVYLDDTSRIRLIVTIVIDVAVVFYLFTGQARRALDR